ncbi:hypothetical protein [uncultured Campylobacter sp.]|uniref:hypothetical protein n=1 Tax=uncultured Campylobacter sp. TaxID=218934 RepID=UPI0028E66C76|nr:hypothetical protein [uncultured Campylobacter sp.]
MLLNQDVEQRIVESLKKYNTNFKTKQFTTKEMDTDILMDFFNISFETKAKNIQYWNRELGMIWELVTKYLFSLSPCFKTADSVDFGLDKPVDYFIGSLAVDAKYRIGSGDSGTLKKFKQYGEMLKNKGYVPTFLILRDDNLPAAITAAKNGGWNTIIKQDAFNFIISQCNIDIVQYLAHIKVKYNF